MFAISSRPALPPVALPVRGTVAIATAFTGLVLFSLGFAGVALGGFAGRLDASQVHAADLLRSAAPVLVTLGIAHFVAALGVLDGSRVLHGVVVAVGSVGAVAAAFVLVDLAVAGDPAGLRGHDPVPGIVLAATGVVVYAALAAIGGSTRRTEPAA